VNFVFVLLTAASVSADPAPTKPAPAAQPAQAPVGAYGGGYGGGYSGGYSGGYGGGCGSCNSCNSCNDCGNDCCEKQGLFDRLRGMFRRHKCGDDCGDSCAPSCGTSCCTPVKVHHHQSCCTPSCGSSCDSCCDSGPSLLDRIRACFRRDKDCCDTGCGSGSGCGSCNGCGNGSGYGAPGYGAPAVGAPTTGQPGKGAEKMPNPPVEKKPGGEKPPVEKPGEGAAAETGAKSPFELARRYEKRVARAADYSKLTGQLCFVHADGGLWVLRYAPLSEEDANGGSVILARDRQMNNYREGDLVTVAGKIISKKGSSRLGAPLYQVQSINLVDRPPQ